MKPKYEEALELLNDEQKQAVETVDGPLLVVAGPGTGKTQLLSTRVAYILKNTDALAGNILCLTFTDNAARNMRERLAKIIGQPAYHVSIHTFHSFGVEIINQYPDFFTERQLLQQVDELGRYELLRSIFETLPHSNPLSAKVGDKFVFLKDALEAIGWLKQNAVSPDELHGLLNANQEFIEKMNSDLAETFAESPLAKYLPKYNKFLQKLSEAAGSNTRYGFAGYAADCYGQLARAIEQVDPGGRYAKAITAWRNDWCVKDASGKFVFKDGGHNYRKMHALANVYQALLEAMAGQGLYDFDDMVIEAVHAVENNDELKFNLQERYQYILVDEFQDTNKAQLRMLYALGDNPVLEGRPNIMAVGDDDQAIYAFQGAETSNMAAFAQTYRVEPIFLKENWRSNAEILEAATGIARQIPDRLETIVKSGKKELVAKKSWKQKVLEHKSFASELAQYDWIAGQISRFIDSGMPPEEIAVIAPRHKYLERLMPYLGEKKIPVAYERRENILDAPLIIQLTTMVELVVAIAQNRQDDADALIAEVLGYDIWGIETEKLIGLSMECYKKHRHWLEVLAASKDENLKSIAGWFADLAKKSRLEPMEYMLDRLIGASSSGSESDEADLERVKKARFVSPFKDFYFNDEQYEQATENYLTLLGQLSTLRNRLRQWKPNRTIYIADLAEFCELHRQAGLKIVDTNPHTQAAKAVQVMTAHKAKGLEFRAVFVTCAQDEVWGPTAKSQSSRISLPRNLTIKPAGDEDRDRLRLLFVALTRAKHTLYVTSYTHDMDNKPSPTLSFIENIQYLDPVPIDKPATAKAVEILATDWSYRFRQIIADKPALMAPILEDYKLSVTHLNNFLDVAEGGPHYFLVHNLLRFPQALSPSAAYGDAVHQTIKWFFAELKSSGKLPAEIKIQDYFSDMIGRAHLKKNDLARLDTRGREAVARFVKEKGGLFRPQAMVERGFNNDGVVIDGARLSGKIDLLDLGGSGKARVTDFKTGKPSISWQGKDEFEKIKLHKYRQQLLFYKLLVEHSASFAGRTAVEAGFLQFIEPDENGKLTEALNIDYEPAELERFTKLVGAVWQKIMELDFPDISQYPHSLKGITAFEQDLIDGK